MGIDGGGGGKSLGSKSGNLVEKGVSQGSAAAGEAAAENSILGLGAAGAVGVATTAAGEEVNRLAAARSKLTRRKQQTLSRLMLRKNALELELQRNLRSLRKLTVTRDEDKRSLLVPVETLVLRNDEAPAAAVGGPFDQGVQEVNDAAGGDQFGGGVQEVGITEYLPYEILSDRQKTRLAQQIQVLFFICSQRIAYLRVILTKVSNMHEAIAEGRMSPETYMDEVEYLKTLDKELTVTNLAVKCVEDLGPSWSDSASGSKGRTVSGWVSDFDTNDGHFSHDRRGRAQKPFLIRDREDIRLGIINWMQSQATKREAISVDSACAQVNILLRDIDEATLLRYQINNRAVTRSTVHCWLRYLGCRYHSSLKTYLYQPSSNTAG
jgi:hypothetical protein